VQAREWNRNSDQREDLRQERTIDTHHEESGMDEILARKMLGTVVMVGVTIMNRREEVQGHEQYFGTVVRISETDGLIIRRGDTGEEMWLPPALDAYQRAASGEYRLNATGQVVVDPDFVATFTRYPPVTH
jgi:hypothetical protein